MILVNHGDSSRRGVSAIEMAVFVPVLAFLLVGMVEVGQLANAAQVVTNSSQLGARMASRDNVSESDIQVAVLDFLDNAFDRVARSELESHLTVVISNVDGTPIQGGLLSNATTGADIKVAVSLDFGSVRWLPGSSFLLDEHQQLEVSTVMRRE